MVRRQAEPAARQEMSGMERLGLRVSSMINHPVAQAQRWVTIHRLDTDGDREWEEVLSVIAETDELELTLNDDGSVTVRWEQQEVEVAGRGEVEFEPEEAAPF
ncbi:DUF1654 domain-containing protein [Pseudomonas gessardii]|uniref:DUF1654 domain-containing protein n=1 Tax=Pseudomonas gessardii TaxID=78544 RepID=A0A7Y1MWF1_9PSED|nr:DUF1654 domain-containing protein [Pseudomonas gessardii]NNA99262.1 DUF1654 domain-containing protein [Pseudomonas gessardii]